MPLRSPNFRSQDLSTNEMGKAHATEHPKQTDNHRGRHQEHHL
jgi:hypothetical protein